MKDKASQARQARLKASYRLISPPATPEDNAPKKPKHATRRMVQPVELKVKIVPA